MTHPTPTHTVWTRGPIAGIPHLVDRTVNGRIVTVCGTTMGPDVDFGPASITTCEPCLDKATEPTRQEARR